MSDISLSRGHLMLKIERKPLQSDITPGSIGHLALQRASKFPISEQLTKENDREDYSIKNTVQNRDDIYHANFGPFKLRSAFQPIYMVTPDNLSLFAFEALVRPEKLGTMVVPSVLFDPSAKYNLAELDRLCRTIHIRNYQLLQNDNATLFLNINPAHFDNARSIETELKYLITDLADYRIPTSRLVCEIIETKAVNDEIITRLCGGLREIGVKIAVDDYGSDHSNWRRFELVRPDILKLDGLVFRNLCKTPAAVPALKNLTESLHEIGCILLVEGVETRNQFEIAIAAGVSLIQGYFLARPQKTAQQFPMIPTAPFLPGQNKIHHSQVFRPTISFNELSGPIQ